MGEHIRKFGAGAIGLVYVTFSLAWIFTSDQIVTSLTSEPAVLTLLQTGKGTAFVLLTGLGLFLMVRLYQRQLTGTQKAAEEAVRRAVYQSPFMTLLVDPSSRRVVDANAVARRQFADNDIPWVGSAVSDVLWPGGCSDRPTETELESLIAEAMLVGTAEAEWVLERDAGVRSEHNVRLVLVVVRGTPHLRVVLKDVTESRVVETILRDLGSGLADKFGAAFHRALARLLTRALGVEHAVVARLDPRDPGRLRTTALFSNDAALGNLDFAVEQTWCGKVLNGSDVAVANEPRQQFSDAAVLGLPPVRGFAGVPLFDSRRRPVGVLVALSDSPIGRRTLVADVLRLAAGRAAAELERMQAEAALSESEQRFQQYASASSGWLWEQDEDLRFTYISERWSEITGHPVERVLGRTRWELNGDSGDEPDWAEHRATLDAHLPFTDFVYSARLSDGTLQYFRASGTPVFDAEGVFQGYRGSSIEATEGIEAEQRADRAQARLMDAIQSLPVAFALFDRDDRLILYNDVYQNRGGEVSLPHAVGMTYKELIKQSMRAMPLHPSMGRPHDVYRRRLRMHRNLPSHCELQLGNGKYVEIREQPTSEGGSVLLGFDITERKRMESELRDSEERFRTLISEASQGIVVHKNMNPQYCNASFAAMFGYDRADEILALDSIEVLFDESERVRLRNYCGRRQQGEDAPTEYEFTGVRRDGTCIAVRNRVVRVPWGEDFAICANMFDISEKKATEAALARSERDFRDLVEGSPQGVVIHTEGRLRFVNRSAAALFGYASPGDALAVRAIERLFGRGWSTIDPDCNAGADSPGVAEFECRRRDGLPVWIEVSARKVDWHGEWSTQLMLADATARKQAEQALRRTQRMEAVGKLSGGVAHDFNNLLGVVIGNLEFLKRLVGTDPKAVARIDGALRATNRGVGLTRRLLGFSTLEARPGTPTNANDVVAGLGEIVAKSVPSGISIDTRLQPDLWLTEIDPGDLEDAVLNLVLNAKDAMPEGGRIVIETGNRQFGGPAAADRADDVDVEAGDFVVISVCDTGTGISPDIIEQVFDPFFTTKSADRGTGLGLSMVYGFAKRSQGHVRICSEPGVGTTVRLTLPRSTNRSGMQAQAEEDECPEATGSETVLLVDDEPDLLDVAEIMLADLGYRTMTARSGEEALQILADCDERVDVVFSDVVMPGGIDGFELARRVGRMRPEAALLLASGFTGKRLAGDHDPELVRRILPKPYDKASVARAIRRVLSHRRVGEPQSSHIMVNAQATISPTVDAC